MRSTGARRGHAPRSAVAALTAVLALLTGCGGQGGQEQPPTPATSPPAQEQSMAPDEVMEPLRADAAERAGVEPGEVQVRTSERVTWNSGALGCPQPGTAYTQALVDGYHVVVQAGGTDYDYRIPDRGDFVLCENPSG